MTHYSDTLDYFKNHYVYDEHARLTSSELAQDLQTALRFEPINENYAKKIIPILRDALDKTTESFERKRMRGNTQLSGYPARRTSPNNSTTTCQPETEIERLKSELNEKEAVISEKDKEIRELKEKVDDLERLLAEHNARATPLQTVQNNSIKSKSKRSGSDFEPKNSIEPRTKRSRNKIEPKEKRTSGPMAGSPEYKELILKEKFMRVEDSEYFVQYENGSDLENKLPFFTKALIVHDPRGLGMCEELFELNTFQKLEKKLIEHLGPEYQWLVINSDKQTGDQGMSLKNFLKLFISAESGKPIKRPSILNSLSNNLHKIDALARLLEPPNYTRFCSWTRRLKLPPQVEHYLLISMAGSFTDFHTDFGGSSVSYYLLIGSKIFWFVRPTSKNLRAFKAWSALSKEENLRTPFIPYLKAQNPEANVYRLELSPGQTLFVPTGWIHAVMTPKDSVAVGANFLQSANPSLQVTIHKEIDLQLETVTNEAAADDGQSFLFPQFRLLNWLAIPLVTKDLTSDVVKKFKLKLRSYIESYVEYLMEIWKSKDFRNSVLAKDPDARKHFKALELLD